MNSSSHDHQSPHASVIGSLREFRRFETADQQDFLDYHPRACASLQRAIERLQSIGIPDLGPETTRDAIARHVATALPCDFFGTIAALPRDLEDFLSAFAESRPFGALEGERMMRRRPVGRPATTDKDQAIDDLICYINLVLGGPRPILSRPETLPPTAPPERSPTP